MFGLQQGFQLPGFSEEVHDSWLSSTSDHASPANPQQQPFLVYKDA